MSMYSPMNNSRAIHESRCSVSPPVASKQTPPSPSKTLPPPPSKMAASSSRRIPSKHQNYSPSLVQFSCAKKRPWFRLNVFSMLRIALVAATMAGISVCVIQARAANADTLQSIILKLIFLAFSLMLSILDLVQFHHSKLPHRVEAMLDLLLAFSFLSFFVVGVLVRQWTTDALYFVVSLLHLLSYFNILVRAHRISLQLQHLSMLTLRDVEKGEKVGSHETSSPESGRSTPESQIECIPHENHPANTISETITAIRSPCAELEGSSRWTLISQKSAR